MKNLVLIAAICISSVHAHAQETKPIPLADYVSFCLALWAGSDVQAKANDLGIQSAIPAGGSITAGKTTIQLYRAAQGSQTVSAAKTIFDEGTEWTCEANLATGLERADLETLERVLGLHGQVLTFGPANVGYWIMPNRQPPVLIKGLAGSRIGILNLLAFEAAAPNK